MQRFGFSRLVGWGWEIFGETPRGTFLCHSTSNEPLNVTFHWWVSLCKMLYVTLVKSNRKMTSAYV